MTCLRPYSHAMVDCRRRRSPPVPTISPWPVRRRCFSNATHALHRREPCGCRRCHGSHGRRPPGDASVIWIPVTIWAAFAQTVRNAAQRSLVAELGTLGATMVRFLYGLPFRRALAHAGMGRASDAMPTPNAAFGRWVFVGGLSQILATALLLQVMGLRNFAVGVAYSKTEVIQVAIFALVFIGDPLSWPTGLAVASGSIGVILLTPADPKRPLRSMLEGLTSRAGLSGPGVAARALRSAPSHSAPPCSLSTCRRFCWPPRTRWWRRRSCRRSRSARGF